MADSNFTLKPLADKIVVKPDVRVLSSVLIVENKEAPNTGVVLAVGPGKKLPNGRREAMPIEVGAKVRFGTMGRDAKEEYLKFTDVLHNGEKCLLMSWQDICGVVE
jgi:chaperonin GroES